MDFVSVNAESSYIVEDQKAEGKVTKVIWIPIDRAAKTRVQQAI